MDLGTDGPAEFGWTKGRWLAGAVALSVVAISLADVADTLRRSPGPGSDVVLHGQQLHTRHRDGGNGPLVVFENGLGLPQTAWSWVLQGLGPGVAYLSYDRPGVGWSSASRRPLTVTRHQELLRSLTRDVAGDGRLILVGHSIGGLLALRYAQAFPASIAGLVLVDATHPQQFERSAAQRGALRPVMASLGRQAVRARLGLRTDSLFVEEIDSLPPGLRERTKTVRASARNTRTARRELRQCASQWLPEAGVLGSLDPVPVAIVTSGRMVAEDPAHGPLQEEFRRISSLFRHDVVEDATHTSVLCDVEHATRVAEAIAWVRARQVVTADETTAQDRTGDRV